MFQNNWIRPRAFLEFKLCIPSMLVLSWKEKMDFLLWNYSDFQLDQTHTSYVIVPFSELTTMPNRLKDKNINWVFFISNWLSQKAAFKGNRFFFKLTMMKLIQNFGKKNEMEMELTSDAKQILFFLKKDVTRQPLKQAIIWLLELMGNMILTIF